MARGWNVSASEVAGNTVIAHVKSGARKDINYSLWEAFQADLPSKFDTTELDTSRDT
jgi:hypothetical protein